jgi:hypothetical protein
MGLPEIGWEGADCTDLPLERVKQQAVVNTAMNIRVP